MKHTTRRMCLTVLLAMLASLIVACGGDGGTAGEGASGGSAAQATTAPATGGDTGAATAAPATGGDTGGQASAGACPPSAANQQITMWSPLTGPDGDEMTGLATQFSGENGQGITVQHLAQPEYIQKLNTAAAGNSLPDMTVIRADDIAEMAVRNVIKPMGDEALTAVGGDGLGGEFPEQVWNVGEYNGQRYAVPLDVHPLVLYYNKDLFEAAGVELPGQEPMSKEQFEQALQTLNKDGVSGIAIGTAFQGATLFWTLLRQFGGDAINDDGTEAIYNSEQGVEALTYLNDLKQTYSPQISGGGDPEVTAFQQGKAAMVIHGPWHISNLSKLPFTGFAPMPQIGDEFAVWGGSHQLALTTEDPAKQAAAACWISWLSQNSVQWAKAGQVPVRESAREGGELEQVAPPVSQFASEVEGVIMPPSVPGVVPAVWGEGFGKAVDAVLLGQQTDIKAALDQAATKSNQLIEQNQQRYGG